MFTRCGNNRVIIVALSVLITGIAGGFAAAAEAADHKAYYVATNGSDENAGTLDKPFSTIQKAADVMKAGDACYIREGRYREGVRIKNSHGDKDKPLTFTAYKGERVVLDGSTPISAKWTKHEGQIYKATTEEPVLWQLFVDGKSMCSARWPNGNWDDGSVWDKSKSLAWPERKNSDFGLHYNQELKEFDFSLKGAIIVVNSGSFKTYTSRVTKHMPSEDHFSFSTRRVRRHFGTYPVVKHGYFLEGKLGLLDVPGEWHFDAENKTVYLWLRDGKNPNDHEVSGKVRSYMFDVTDSSYVRLEGVDFFASTFSFIDSHHCEVVSCDLMYPSYSRRMMNNIWPIKVTRMLVDHEFDPAYNKIVDCTMEYMDGPAIEMDGKGNVIENCYIHDVDYSCTYDGGWTTNTVNSPELVFRRNTIHTTGASELFKAGVRNLIEFNDLSHSGYLQNDGSLVQVSVKSQKDTIVRYNWVHDSVKQGIRFDNSNVPNSPWGEGGRTHHNVSWKTDRVFFKGDKHFIHNNLCFDSANNDLIISSAIAINGLNYETVTRNNIAGTFSGSRTKTAKDFPVPGIVDHNWTSDVKGRDIRTQLRDPDNLDFRPKTGSELVDAGKAMEGYSFPYSGKKPDIGPYEYGDNNYWIPGRQLKRASKPVPPDEAANVKIDADVMWLAGYKSESHEVYFGTDEKAVEKATPKSAEYKGRQKNNIFAPGTLKKNTKYFWRVDVINGKDIIKGQVWCFETGTAKGNS